jgi:hypothetical protein
MKYLVLFALLFTSCGGFFQKKDNKPKPTIQTLEELNLKASDYARWTADLENSEGIIPHFKCDSLLFQSLYEVATNGDLDMKIYEGDPGQWFRKSTHNCFYRNDEGEPVKNGSSTTISRDMFLGLFIWLWVNKDLESVEDLISYGKSADPEWFMGDGVNFLERESRTHLRPSILGTLYQLVYRLGGEDNPNRTYFPYTPDGSLNGYQRHLVVTHTLLRGILFDGLSDYDLGELETACSEQPANAYYCAVFHHFKDGDQSQAISSLFDQDLFPDDRLPYRSERCSDYIFQRDDDRVDPDPTNDDWKPCHDGSGDGEIMPGVDFLWATWVINLSTE